MDETLVEIGRRICANADVSAKPLKIYAIYDRYFRRVLEQGRKAA